MPQTTIPLVGPFTRRLMGSTSVDQKYTNCVFTEATSSALGNKIVYIEKRNGISTLNTPESGSTGRGVFYVTSTNKVISAFSPGSGDTIYSGTTLLGALTGGAAFHFSDCVFNGITFVLITSSVGAFFYASNATLTSFTGTTHTNTIVDGIATTVGLYAGQPVSKADFQAGTRIASVDSGTQITITLAATGSASGTVTVTPLAKIIDADFPTNICGPLVEMDGYVFIGTTDGKIYNSDLNSVTSWGAANFISANISTDPGVGCFKFKNKIGFFGTSSLEFFINSGNTSGSVLSREAGSAASIGCAGGGLPSGIALVPASFYAKYDAVYWLDPFGVLYILRDGIKKASNPGILLNNVGPTTVSFFNYRGMSLLSMFDGTGATYWYSLDYDQFIATSFAEIWIDSNAVPGTYGVTYVNTLDNTSGKVFTLAPSPSTNTYQDNGSAFTMTIQTEPHVLNKGRGFIVKGFELIGDTQSSGSTTLETSGDDYANFSTMGTFDLTAARKRIEPGGYYANHLIARITDSGNNAWRGQALLVDWEPCAA